MPNVFEALSFVNPSGKTVKISDPSVTKYWELRGRSGFSAPDVELITQRFANGTTKVLKRFIAPRTVRINMILTGDTTAERDQYFAQMVRDLIDISGGTEGKLYVTKSDGTIVYLNCTYSSGMNVVDEYRKLHRFTLEFYAADPYFYRDLPIIPFIITGNGTVLIEGVTNYFAVAGEAPAQPVIKLSNSVLEGHEAFSFYADGIEKFVLKSTILASDQTLVIDTRDFSKSIYIINSDNSITQAAKYLQWSNTGLDVEFSAGSTNNIAYFKVQIASSSTFVGSAEMLLSHRYLSA